MKIEINLRTSFTALAVLGVSLAALGLARQAQADSDFNPPAWLSPQTQKASPSQTAVPRTMFVAPMTPEYLSKLQQAGRLAHDAAIDLHAGNYAQAEAEAREAISIGSLTAGVADEVLAAALEAQGKDQEALQAYWVMVVDQNASYPRVLLPYAQLLLKSGQWAQAVAVYNQTLPTMGNE